MIPAFEARGLTVWYDRPVVHSVSFSISPGELVGILGRNGCGKTTLLRGITGAAAKTEGQVLVRGEPVLALRVRDRARRIAMLPQHIEVMPGVRVGEVIAMGCYARAGLLGRPGPQERARVEQAAGRFGLTELLETDCAILSEGQRQLTQLARLFVQDAPVLLLDEPNSALDFLNSHRLFHIVRGMLAETGGAGAVVLHDPTLALRYCDRLLLMEKGRFLEELRPATVDGAEIQRALRRLYPGLSVKQDKADGTFTCTLD